MLQKSNYYLTRNKDKWQIFYITNARPAPTGPVFTWHWTTNPPLAFRLLANKPLLTIQRFWFSDLRLENGTLLYIHLQCWSPQSVISGIFEVSISVDPLSSLLHRPPCRWVVKSTKGVLGNVLTNSSFEDMRWAYCRTPASLGPSRDIGGGISVQEQNIKVDQRNWLNLEQKFFSL